MAAKILYCAYGYSQGRATVKIPVVRLNHIGLPRSGKTSFRRCLRGDFKDILGAIGSTGVAESSLQILQSTCYEINTMTPVEGWSVFSRLEDEAKMLNDLIYHITKRNKSPDDIAAEHAVKDEYIEEIFSLLAKVVRKDWEQLKYLFKDLTLVINNDTGGQAEFLDLHCSLVSGPSLNLFFSRLTDNLDEPFNTSFTNKGGESTPATPSTMTVEEVMFQSLACIACFSDQYNVTKKARYSSNYSSKVLMVGTHRDKVSDKEFKEKDQLLQKTIKKTDFYERDMVLFKSENQLMLDVNNLYGGKKEVDTIRKLLEKIITQHFGKIEIPVAWLILSFCIRNMKKRTVSLESCEKLAEKLNINSEELQDALLFLHHCVGVLLYYPELEALKSTVICDIQLVFDSASNLISNTFTFEKVGHRAHERFRKLARFSQQDLEKAISNQTSDLLPLNKLVQLLEHLNILTQISGTSACNVQEKTYFMPCVLESARASELTVTCSDSDPAPLMLRYECGYAPVGVFPAMITNLVSQHRKIGWEMHEEGLRKNRVQFSVGKDYDTITLISHPRYFEFVLMRNEGFKMSTESVCHEVLDVIESTLKSVTSHMNYFFSMGYNFGFECPVHPTREHLCIVSDKTAWRMKCLQDPKQTFLLEASRGVWFTASVSNQSGIPQGIV